MKHGLGLNEVLLEEFDDADGIVEQIKACVRRDGYFAPHPDVLGVHDLNGACAPITVATGNRGISLPLLTVPMAVAEAFFSLIAWSALHPDNPPSPPRPARRPPPQKPPLLNLWAHGSELREAADSPGDGWRCLGNNYTATEIAKMRDFLSHQ